MSRHVRLFPTYSQKENQTTNHCLLILKMLYEENPNLLSEVLSILLGEEISGVIGVEFKQQKHSSNGISDGEISQQPFSILIETKLGDNFNLEQLKRYIENLKLRDGKKVLIALGNFQQDLPTPTYFLEIAEQAKESRIAFIPISFEQFIEAIKQLKLTQYLADATSDLEEYLDENNLLPSWKYQLDVVNCAGSFESVEKNKIYVCPAKGGAYNHRRSLYFGAYRNKCVEYVSKIRAVIDLESETGHKLLWKNDNLSDDELYKIAIERFTAKGEPWYPARIFLLDDDLSSTKFVKSSKGGMLGSKQYFDISQLNVVDAQDLAEKIKGKTWENYQII